MKKHTPYQSIHQNEATGPVVDIGFDVHKKTIYLAALCGRVWLLERVFDAADLSKLHQALKKLAKHGRLGACYEASGAGFWLQRQMAAWGVPCEVIAPFSCTGETWRKEEVR